LGSLAAWHRAGNQRLIAVFATASFIFNNQKAPSRLSWMSCG
jgi:hypothetical protein